MDLKELTAWEKFGIEDGFYEKVIEGQPPTVYVKTDLFLSACAAMRQAINYARDLDTKTRSLSSKVDAMNKKLAVMNQTVRLLDGMPVLEITNRLQNEVGVSNETLKENKRLRKELDKIHNSNSKRNERMYGMRLAGMTYKEIGEKYALSAARVSQLIHRIERRDRRLKNEHEET